MRKRVLVVLAALPLLGAAACGGAVRAASNATDNGSVGCGGWYAVSHDVLTAELQLNGAVRAVAVNALLDDGTVRGTGTTLAVLPGASHRTVHVRNVGSSVLSVKARVIDVTGAVQATCDLSNPH